MHNTTSPDTSDAGIERLIQAKGKTAPRVSGDTACKHCGHPMHDHGWIDTLEGGHIVCPGDWVITGVAGERYPCKPAIFHATYEQVAD